jgi:hypothetical protein
LPIVLCPFHSGEHIGAQAFKGRYTKRFATRPAILEQASGVTVESPGGSEIAGKIGMELNAGDRIRTGPQGFATIRFDDASSAEAGSSSNLRANSDVTVLQCFMNGQGHAPLYTVLRQTLGDVLYRVHKGSKFDVTTPTTTAGALGTEFQIVVRNDGTGSFKLNEGVVELANVWTFTRISMPMTSITPFNSLLSRSVAAAPTPTPVPTATPLPTATPIPQPTATPIPLPTAVPTATATPQPTATPTPRPTTTPTPAPSATPVPTATPCPGPGNSSPNSGQCDDHRKK